MEFIRTVNQFLWGGPILILLLGIHIYHTIFLRFVQRKIGKGISLSLGEEKKSSLGFSRFGSLTTTLAATLGTGNIVGVSTAVFLGGPGAVFWCWITGILGMATTYAETFLSGIYRWKDKEGEQHGGPMYILRYTLKKKGMAFFYSLALCCSALFIGCTVQSNAITQSCSEVFHCSPVFSAIATCFLVGLILMQGTTWIERFSIYIVPSMAFFFFGGCLLYLLLHYHYILPALREILISAFVPQSIGCGVAGYGIGKAVRYGVARGLFTNESGLGTAGLIAGSAAEDKPKNQALISMSATFWDTVVLCAITGIMLVSYQIEYSWEWQNVSAGSLTTAAFRKLPFFGDEILGIAIVCFALATLVGWSYIGKQGYDFIFHKKYPRVYQTIYIVMIFIGGQLPLTFVWEMADLVNLFLLFPTVYLLLKCRHVLKK